MILYITVNWDAVGSSLLRTLFGFVVIYIPYFVARALTEVSRKGNRKPLRFQYFKAYGSGFLFLAGLGCVLLLFLTTWSHNEDTGEDTPPMSWPRAETRTAIIILTLAIPVVIGIARGFHTPQVDVEKIPDPSPYDDYDNQ